MIEKITKLLNTIYKLLSSRKTAATAIAVLSLFFILSTIIPQQSNYDRDDFEQMIAAKPVIYKWADDAGLTDVYRSALMQAAFWLFYLNLLFNIGRRISRFPSEIRVVSPKLSPAVIGRAPLSRTETVNGADDLLESAAGFLRKKHFYVVARPEAASLRAVLNRMSVIGSILFHGSIIFLVIGIQVRGLTKYSGAILLGEGEEFTGNLQQYVSITPFGIEQEDLPDLNFVIKDFEEQWEDGRVISDFVAIVDDLNNPGEKWRLRVNEPFRIGDTNVRLIDFGVGTKMELRNLDDNKEYRANLLLDLYPPGASDSFVFPGDDTRFYIELYPDFIGSVDDPKSKSLQLNNPMVVLYFTDNVGRKIRTWLKPGEWVRKGSLVVSFYEVIYWVQLHATRDGSRTMVYLSFILGLIGLCWRMLAPRRRIDIFIDESDGATKLYIGGNSDFSANSFKFRFNRLVDELTKGMNR